jgi:WD40 repeat protein
MAMNVRRQFWGAILMTTAMVLTMFSVLAAPVSPIDSELDVVDEIENDEALTPSDDVPFAELEDEVSPDKAALLDMEDLEYPEVFYPSGMGGEEPLGEDPIETSGSALIDNHDIQGAWDQGVNGSGVNVALIDTGIDLGQPDLIGTFATDNKILGYVVNEVVVESADSLGVKVASLDHDYVIENNATILRNGSPFSNYMLYPKNGTIIFTPPLSAASEITATYTYASPYYGWPIAFDPVSMSNFLENNHTKDTWFANCTQIGSGPFEYSHTLIVDGETEFGGIYEKWGTDKRDNFDGADGGNKLSFDLTSLNLTYDKDFWYVGFPTFLIVEDENTTKDFVAKVIFGVMFDVDNETSGTTTVPEGKLIDTNTSHSDWVLDAEFSPDGTMIATASRDRSVRVWNPDGTRVKTLYGHGTAVYALAWSLDGTKLAAISKDRLNIWEVATWDLSWWKDITTGMDLDENYGLSSFLAFSPNGTTVAYGGAQINFYDFDFGGKGGNTGYDYFIYVAPNSIRTLAYDPLDITGQTLATALDIWPVMPFYQYVVVKYNLATANFNTGAIADNVPLKFLPDHMDTITSLAWSQDRTKIVAGDLDSKVLIWNVDAESTISTIDAMRPVTSVDWSSTDVISYTTTRNINELPFLNTTTSGGAPLNGVTGRLTYFSVDWSPLGNYLVTSSMDLSARVWNSNLQLQEILVAQKPDYALYVEGGAKWNKKDLKWEPGFNRSKFYTWNVTHWENVTLQNLTKNQTEAYQIYGASQFIEVAIPRSLLGNPTSMAVEMFSVPFNDTWPAQDSVPNDVNVFYMPEKTDGRYTKDLAWLPIVTSLSTFTWKGVKYYYADASLSKSGVFHFGIHPSPHITNMYGAVGVLVVDSARPFDYDTVYVDMNTDNVFNSQDEILTRDSPTLIYDENGNGMIDVGDTSGGIMYFISDGYTPIPYSEPYSKRRGETDQEFTNIIPLNGNIVAFIGEYFIDEDTLEKAKHGTWMASLMASQGKLPGTEVEGVSPGARFVVLANTREEIEHSWYFAVQGYDGDPGTGDEAQIILNAFNYPRVTEKGWDSYSRKVDELSMDYADEASLFVGPGGDYGFGYGTVSSPNAAPGVVTVGRASDYTYLVSSAGEGPTPHYGDVEISSSRGPTPVGIPKPDVVAIGVASTYNPLFESLNQSRRIGSDVSAAVTTGVLALIYEGFYTKNKRFPTATEAKEILMSGADNINYDPLCQGAGFVNANRSVSIALGNGGISVSPSTFTFGEYQGERYPSFTNILSAGDTDEMTFSVRNNDDTQQADVSLETSIFEKTGEYYLYNYTHKDNYTLDGEIIFWINSGGIFKVREEGIGIFNITSQLDPFDPTAWDNAQLIKITAYTSYELMVSVAGVSPTGRKSYAANYSYTMTVYDWHNTSIGYPEPENYRSDLNTMAESFGPANVILGVDPMTNVIEARIHDPASRIHDGLVVNLEPWGDPPDQEVKWEFLIETYEKAEWPWLNLFPKNIFGIQPEGSATFRGTLDVPSTAKVGSYEGAIEVTDVGTGKITTIPILVNVAINSPNLEFGGVPGTSDLYDNNRIFGGYDKGMRGTSRLARPYTGDWRFYYFDIPDAGVYKSAGLKIWIEGNWTLKPSDMDFYVLGYKGEVLSSRHGPYTLGVIGKSEEAKEPGFETNTNESSEIIAFDMKTGVNVLALHGVILNGSLHYEFVSGGGGGWIQVTPPEIYERRSVRYGEKDLRVISNLDFLEGMTASAVGPAITESYKEVEIEQDYQTWWQFDNWGEYLQRGSYTKIINVTGAYILEVHIVGDDKAPDLDLGVFKEDEPPDGKLELEEVKDIYCVKIGGTKWTYDADMDADERVVWIEPPDGTYIIKVLGFDISGKYGHFDIDISITLGTGEKGYWIEGTGPDDIILGTEGGLLALNPVGFTMHWNLQGSTPPGEYGGAVMIGTPSAPTIVIVPVTIIYDPNPPEIVSFQISAIGYEIDIETNLTTNHPRPTLQINLADSARGELDPGSPEVFLDGVNITSQCLIVITYAEFEGKYGYWDGSITYEPPARLKNGLHTVDVRIADLTGNIIEGNFTFVIDTIPPFIELIGPAVYSTQDDTATISGYTEADKFVVVREFELVADEDGYFEVELALEEGVNTIDIIAIDWFGKKGVDVVRSNPNFATQTIIYDTKGPVLTEVRFDTQSPTNKEYVGISGIVEEYIAEDTPYDPRTVKLTINGEEVEIQSDGYFDKLVMLQEGVSTYNLVATDAAGFSVQLNRTITKDTSPPSLTVDELPSSTDSSVVKVTGTVDTGSILTVNGKIVSIGSLGAFEENVNLQPGPNVITVTATDSAQNVRNFQVVVVRESADMLPYIILIVAIIVCLIVGFFLGSRLRKEEIPEEEEMIEEEALAEEPTAEEEVEEVPEEAPSVAEEEIAIPEMEEELIGEEG